MASVSERHAVATQVASLMSEALSTDCAVDENFLALGGDSLGALSLATALEEAFSIPISERVIFDHLTSIELADYIIEQRDSEDPAENRTGTTSAVRSESSDWFPLSLPQQTLGPRPSASKGQAIDPAFNVSSWYRIRGAFSASVLRDALRSVAERHEMLRAEFANVDGGLVQRVRRPEEVDVVVDVLQARSETVEEARDLARQASDRPFALGTEALVRATIVEITRGDVLLVLTMNHWISDTAAFDILHNELSEAYQAVEQGSPHSLRRPELSYEGYVRREEDQVRDAQQSGRLDETVAYWRQRLATVRGLRLVTREEGQQLGRALDDVTLRIAARGSQSPLRPDALRAFCARERVTPFLACLTALACSIHERTGEQELPFLVVDGNRRMPDTDEVIGCFDDYRVALVGVDQKENFAHLVGAAREQWSVAVDHQPLPFAAVLPHVPELIKLLDERDVLTMQWLGEEMRPAFPNAACTPEADDHSRAAEHGGPVDLHIAFWPRAEEVVVSAGYDAELWDRADIIHVLDGAAHILSAAIAEPETPLSTLLQQGAGT